MQTKNAKFSGAGERCCPTKEQIGFVEKYVPFLEDMLEDQEKLQWCNDYVADNSAIMLGDKKARE